MKHQKEKLSKTNPFIIISKKNKTLVISLPNEVKDLYSKNCKMLMKEQKIIQTNGKIYCALRLEESIL